MNLSQAQRFNLIAARHRVKNVAFDGTSPAPTMIHVLDLDVQFLLGIVCQLRDAVQENHDWHLRNDDYGGYQESELHDTNHDALRGLDDLVLTGETSRETLPVFDRMVDFVTNCLNWGALMVQAEQHEILKNLGRL